MFSGGRNELASCGQQIRRTLIHTVKPILADCQVRLANTAIELLSPLADADSTNRTIAYLLGSALISQGDLTKGQQVIDRVFRDDDSAEARLLMGSILLAADEAQNALKEFQRAIELNPKLPGIQGWYGRALMRLGDSERAKNAFKTELASNANDFESNLYIGVLYRQDRQTAQALTYLSKAARLRPRDQYACYHLSPLTRKTPEITRPLLEGAKEHGDSPKLVLLASAHYRLKRKEDGDRENAIVQKLNAEQQAKQPGSQGGVGQSPSPKPPSNPNNTTKQPPNE